MTSCEINKLWEEKSAGCSADPTTSWPTFCLPASFFVKCSCFASMFYVCWWIQLKNELYCTLIYNYSRVVIFFTAKKQKINCWQLPVWQIKFNGPQNWIKTVSQTLCNISKYRIIVQTINMVSYRDETDWDCLSFRGEAEWRTWRYRQTERYSNMESVGPRDVRVVTFYSFYIYFFKWKW